MGTAGRNIDGDGDRGLKEGCDDVAGGIEKASGGVQLNDHEGGVVSGGLFQGAVDEAFLDGVDHSVDANNDGMVRWGLGESDAEPAEGDEGGEEDEGQDAEGNPASQGGTVHSQVSRNDEPKDFQNLILTGVCRFFKETGGVLGTLGDESPKPPEIVGLNKHRKSHCVRIVRRLPTIYRT